MISEQTSWEFYSSFQEMYGSKQLLDLVLRLEFG